MKVSKAKKKYKSWSAEEENLFHTSSEALYFSAH